MQEILLVSRPCPNGGIRLFALCPITADKVLVLALMDSTVMARRAARLPYKPPSGPCERRRRNGAGPD